MRFLIFLLSFGVLCQNAMAEEGFRYVDPATISPELLAPPYSAEDPRRAAELAKILEMQKDVPQAEIDEANAEAWLDIEDVIPGFDAEKFEKVANLAKAVQKDCFLTVNRAKEFWTSTRPYLADNQVKSLIKSPSATHSYPSGHTACGHVVAEVAGQVMPDKREVLRERANEIAQHRIMVGMHWPNDIRAGEQMGFILLGALEQSADFRKDVEEAAKEYNANKNKEE